MNTPKQLLEYKKAEEKALIALSMFPTHLAPHLLLGEIYFYLGDKEKSKASLQKCMEEDIPINTADKHGNTLLILAAQQGSKRMVKFLLRRGADVNAQNMNGCTVLHYCHAYSHAGLADYLISRGADDSIVNLDGLTCYEGLAYEDIMLED